MGSVLLKNGLVIDGTGGASFHGHVLMTDGKIGSVYKENDGIPHAEIVMDVTGCAIAPGFIDVHSHSDWILPLEDHPQLLKCMLEQGVTTLVAGNCGFSPAPAGMGEHQDLIGALRPLLHKPFDLSWRSMGEFLDTLEKTGPVVNVAQLVGHAGQIGLVDAGRDPLLLGIIQIVSLGKEVPGLG